MDHQCRENGERNMYSNYNQIRAYVELSPNQLKKIIPYRPFHRAIDETLKIPEKCWPFLYPKFTTVLQFSYMVESRSFSPKVIKDLKRNCKEFKGAR